MKYLKQGQSVRNIMKLTSKNHRYGSEGETTIDSIVLFDGDGLIICFQLMFLQPEYKVLLFALMLLL